MSLRAVRRLVLLFFLSLVSVPFQMIVDRFHCAVHETFPLFYWRMCLRVLGITLVITGEKSRDHPTLFVSNHSSYLDIAILGSLVKGSFISRIEVSQWPFFGLLGKLNKSLFFDRRNPRQIKQQRDILGNVLRNRKSLIMFPEGTSSDGNRVLPFKSSLFDAASTRIDGHVVAVQPISITATKLDSIPIGRTFRPLYAWYGDMELIPHLWVLFTCQRLTVEVIFHPPTTLDQFTNRKELSHYCERIIAVGVDRSIRGHSFAAVTG